MLEDGLLETAKRRGCIQPDTRFLPDEPIDQRVVALDRGVLVSGGHGKAAAVHAVEPDIDQLEICLVQYPPNGAEGVVLDVLVAYGVVRGGTKHGRHVRLLEMPHTVCREARTYVAGECDGILEVVEHRHGCDHSRRSAG